MFFTLFGYWVPGGGGGGAHKGLVHNLNMQFFTLGSSKMDVFETYFFDTVIAQYDHPRYVKHVLGRIYVFFTLFGYWVPGGGGGGLFAIAGGLTRDWYTTCLCSFSPWAAQKSNFLKLIFSIP